MEEGFLQKSFLLHDDYQTVKKTLDTYLALIPKPYAVLFIDTPDISLITQRLAQRTKVIASHLNADQDTLENETKKWRQLLNIAVAALEQNGVKVCRLEASRPIQENVAFARQFLDNLK
ncbi:hypothetical protein I0P70_15625 [Pontibacter sp. FD36]|uniref:hypothetical protein n=1 Tax=Pontibacter sp. FD36 TaxID=2789860 RepID=UPI0018AADEAE|nr:hypothetical protein [Pontibacter sp. FD36]MBF8964679.1 hypothetical protein [Pontibacter sp. FD36]